MALRGRWVLDGKSMMMNRSSGRTTPHEEKIDNHPGIVGRLSMGFDIAVWIAPRMSLIYVASAKAILVLII